MRLRIIFALFFLLLCAVVCRAEPRYFVTVYAYDSSPSLARYSHTFAKFEKRDGATTEEKVISWGPAAVRVGIVKLPERGVNSDLPTTFANAKAVKAHVSSYGPYEIKPELYAAALRQIARLESGTVRYQAVDVSRNATNCIHACADAAPGPKLIVGPTWGAAASRKVVEYFRPWFVSP